LKFKGFIEPFAGVGFPEVLVMELFVFLLGIVHTLILIDKGLYAVILVLMVVYKIFFFVNGLILLYGSFHIKYGVMVFLEFFCSLFGRQIAD